VLSHFVPSLVEPIKIQRRVAGGLALWSYNTHLPTATCANFAAFSFTSDMPPIM